VVVRVRSRSSGLVAAMRQPGSYVKVTVQGYVRLTMDLQLAVDPETQVLGP